LPAWEIREVGTMAAREGEHGWVSFTSESVTEGQADKLADQVSDAILDAILAKDPLARVACECAITKGLVLVTGQISTDCYVDIQHIIRETIREAGYARAKYGFDAETCGVVVSIDEQSPDIAAGVNVGGAGDSGVVVGYACDQTPELMPLPIMIAHRLVRRLSQLRRSRELSWLRPDGAAQVSVGYDAEGRPATIDSVVVSAQHHEEVDLAQVREEVEARVIRPILSGGPDFEDCAVYVNPTGRFVVGGPSADAGMTGRCPAIDTYGGWARHGGGWLSGQDPTKVHRAGAYGARHAAKNVVAAGLAASCEVQLAYAIGVSKPVSVRVDTFGSGRVADSELARALLRTFDLSPLGIIREMTLRRPIYRAAACFGHFGRTDMTAPWEDVSRAAALRAELA